MKNDTTALNAAWSQVRPIFSDYFPDDSLPVQLESGNQSFNIIYDTSDAGDMTLMAVIVPEMQEVEIDRLLVYDKARIQSMGLVAYTMMACIARVSRYPTLALECGYSLGTYVWGRCGVEPDIAVYPTQSEDLSREMSRRLEQLSHLVPHDICDPIAEAIKLKRAESFHAVVDCDFDLGDTAPLLMDRKEVSSSLMRYANLHEGRVPLGLALTAHTKCRVIHDLQNAQRRERLLTRVAKRKPCLVEKVRPLLS